jgi:ribulose kinase
LVSVVTGKNTHKQNSKKREIAKSDGRLQSCNGQVLSWTDRTAETEKQKAKKQKKTKNEEQKNESKTRLVKEKNQRQMKCKWT